MSTFREAALLATAATLSVLACHGGRAKGQSKDAGAAVAGCCGYLSGTTFYAAQDIDAPTGELSFGEAHESDWKSGTAIPHAGLQEVVILAEPLGRPKRTVRIPRFATNSADNLVCGTHCTRVVATAGDSIFVTNTARDDLSLRILVEGRAPMDVVIPAKTEARQVSVRDIPIGIHRISHGRNGASESWLLKEPPSTIIDGPTSGNCRFNLILLPGKYQITAWHPTLPSLQMPVTIARRRGTRLVFRFGTGRPQVDLVR